MKLGVQIVIDTVDIESKIAKAREIGFDYCQLVCWNLDYMTDEMAEKIINACNLYNVKISSWWAGWSKPMVWNFTEGPLTIGIVPPEYRYQRMQELMRGSDFAKKLGVDKVATHIGFVPENPNDPNFMPVVSAVKYLANYFKKNGQYFLFETGEETPVTLVRLIEATGCDNLGVNYDTANLILYGKANPVDALGLLGKYIMDIHAKDGDYPTNGKDLGKQKKIGEGSVDFPAIIAELKKIGYDGTITIEREIKGEQQIIDIIDSKKYLEELI